MKIEKIAAFIDWKNAYSIFNNSQVQVGSLIEMNGRIYRIDSLDESSGTIELSPA